MLNKKIIAAAVMSLAVTSAASANNEVSPKLSSLDSKIGKLEFVNEYPTEQTLQTLTDARKYQRATQAYIWAVPITSMADFILTFKESLNLEFGDLMRLNKPADLKYGITANATTDYVVTWVNLETEGPWVVDVPAGPSAGFVVDMWQRPVMDLGIPGVNQGKGGKHLIIGPNQDVPENTEGYHVVHSTTNHALMILRVLARDPAEKEAMIAATRLYPFAEAANPREQKIEHPNGRYWSTSQPRGIEYWNRLKWIIDQEPMHDRDGFMYAFLKDLGIEKGKPFTPSKKMTDMLTEATFVGEAMTKDIDWSGNLEAGFYADGTNWRNAIAVSTTQRQPTHFELDERAAWFYEALTSSKGMKSTTPGVGSAYLGGYKDSDGEWLDGAQSYKLNIPANVPAKRFWSVTVYDNATRYLIQNEQVIADKSSVMDLDKNSDGSIDIYFGPKAPKGHEKNWIPTNPGEGWFSYFRLYGPTQEHFDRKWVLPNFEKTSH
ncbi:DUF1254 domain-containing protein [Colwelliaceae bacterium BS250]